MAKSSGAKLVPRYFSKAEVMESALFAVPPVAPNRRLQRKTGCPIRTCTHNPREIAGITGSLRHFRDDFIVYGQYYRIT